MIVSGELALETPIELTSGSWALFSARARGNLSASVGPGARDAPRVRDDLCRSVGCTALYGTRQVHGNALTIRSSAGDRDSPAADGQVTELSGVALMALTADCIPVALAANGAVAILHAGWRGLAAGVLERGTRAVSALTGASRVVGVIGPAAGRCCYEVGDEVRAVLGSAHCDGRHIDLRAIARQRLLAAGVSVIGEVDTCTICDERLFSHRREGALAGRQAGVVWRS